MRAIWPYMCCSWVPTMAALLVTSVSTSPSYAQFDTIINVPPDEVPASIGSNTQLNLFDGGALPDYFAAGSEVGTSASIEANIFGGSVGYGFNAFAGAEVNISGGNFVIPPEGQFGITGLKAFDGARVTISGGIMESGIHIQSGVLNVTGGVVGPETDMGVYSEVLNGSQATISGGTWPTGLEIRSGSQAMVSGGVWSDGVYVSDGGKARISGGSFSPGRAFLRVMKERSRLLGASFS